MEGPTKELPNWTTARFRRLEVAGRDEGRQDGRFAVGVVPAEDEKAKVYACPLFRKEFQVKGEIRRATLYGSAWASTACTSTAARGQRLLHARLDRLSSKRVYYNTYDVTELVKASGANAIGGVLGAGWYAGQIAGPAKTSTATGPGCSPNLKSNWPTAPSRP